LRIAEFGLQISKRRILIAEGEKERWPGPALLIFSAIENQQSEFSNQQSA